MESNSTDIRFLMIERLENTIAPSDNLFLQGRIEERADIRDLWEEMQELYKAQQTQTMLKNLDPEQEWGEIDNRISQRKTYSIRKRLVQLSAAAAVLFAFFFIYNRSTEKNRNIPDSPKASVTPSANKIILQTQGKTFDLSSNQLDERSIKDLNLSFKDGGIAVSAGKQTTWNTLTIPAGADYQLTLPDSTFLQINSASSIRFPSNFNGPFREIYVEGEAFLEVKKDISKPFRVHTGDATITVLGTAFNVNNYNNDQLKVSLVKGKVGLANNADSVTLSPGYQASSINGHQLSIDKFDEKEVLSWMKGQYIFANKELSYIASILERCYNIHVVFDDTKIKTKKFTGILFKRNSISSFLSNLSSTGEIAYSFQDNILHFSNPGFHE